MRGKIWLLPLVVTTLWGGQTPRQTVALAQTGVDGTWHAESRLPGTGTGWAAALKVDGPRVTGAVSSCSSVLGAIEIFDGRSEGSNVTFKCTSGDGQRTLTLTGTIDGDEITFTWEKQVREGGYPRAYDVMFGTEAPKGFIAKRVGGAGTAMNAAALREVVDPMQGGQVQQPRTPRRIQVASTLDGTMQDSYVIRPSRSNATEPRPLLVVLHTWSTTLESWSPTIEREATARDWIVLYPNFRGASDHPEACGSPLAQQDVLDAVTWVRQNYPVDASRVYVTGWSGGGFMTLMMASRHPQVWAAASAWSSIADLAEWYREDLSGEFRKELEGCFGGGPGTTEAVGARYRDQSPLTHLKAGSPVPIDIGHGSEDTQVSVRHSLRAFAALAPSAIADTEIEQLVASNFQGAAEIADPLIQAPIVLRRVLGNIRLSIYEGEHGFYPRAAIEWMSAHQRR